MRLSLPSLLYAALMASVACAPSARAAVYLAEGVNESDLAGSERFYDGGKGRDWYEFESEAYKIYTANKNDMSIFGDLASSISAPEYQSRLDCSKLYSDNGHCWAYTSSNMLQYWQTYYGVFSGKVGEDKAAPVHGLNYDEQYIEQLGGTQSLKLNKLFYDSFEGSSGGSTNKAFGWYLYGENEWLGQKDYYSGAPGYFRQYFGHYNDTHTTTNAQNLSSLEAMSDSIKQAFGYTKQNGEWVQTTKGQIMHLELKSGTGSHAITCYGFETDADGNIKALYIVNSDDADYQLVKVYTKFANYGTYDYRLELHYDEACSGTSSYNAWAVTGWSNLNTPQVLKDMLREYESGNMTWMGTEGVSWKNSSDTVNVDELPTDATGWMTYAGTNTQHAGYYNTYYDAERGVVFNDEAASGAVQLAENISTPSMTVDNNALAYTFSGGETSRTITTDSFIRKGNAAVTFENVKLVAGTATLEGDVTFDELHVTGTLQAKGKRIHANSITLNGDATVGAIGANGSNYGVGTTALTITGGTTTIENDEAWTNLKALTLSDTAKLSVGASLSVSDNISYSGETMPQSGSASINTTYCLYVGTEGQSGTGNVKLAGSINAGAYIKILGDAQVTGNVSTTKDYIDIAGTATIGGNLDAGSGSITLGKGGTIGGTMKAGSITLKGDTSALNIAQNTAIIVLGGKTATREVAWTYLQSLEISETACYTSAASVDIAGDISTATTAAGTLPAGTEAGIAATFCIKVGGNVKLAGNMNSGAYIDIKGTADIAGNLTLTGSTDEHYVRIGSDLMLGGNLSSKKQVTVGGNATIGGTTSLDEGLAVTGDLRMEGNGTVQGAVAARSLSLASGTTLATNSSLTVTGEATGEASGTRARVEAGSSMQLGGSVSDLDMQAQSISLIAANGTATLTNAHLTVGENGVLTLENVVMDAQSILSGGAGATLVASNLTIQLGAENMVLTQVPLSRTARAMTLSSPGPQLELSCSALEGLTITGEGLTFELGQLSAADQTLLGSASSVVLTFTDGNVDFSQVNEITLTMNDEVYAQAVRAQGSVSSFTFTPPTAGGAAIPEPATATLSLLALAALAARRRRR